MKRSNVFWGSVIVLLGVVLLASNLGGLGNRVWVFFWPGLIILAGVWFLLKSNWKTSPAETVVSNIPLESGTDAEIEFKHGAGRLVVDGSAQPGDLISGSYVGGVTSDINKSGAATKVSLRSTSNMGFDGNWGVGGHGFEWKVGVTQQIPVKLHFHTGASESILDLSSLKASEIVLETGASSTEVTLPANAGYSHVKIESGVASVKITIPAGVAADIHIESGLSGINVDSARFVRDGNYYRSADYATAANKIDLEIETGVGSVEIH